MTIQDPGIILGGPEQYNSGDLGVRQFENNYTRPYHSGVTEIVIDSLYIDPHTEGGVYVLSSFDNPSTIEFDYCEPHG